MKKLTALAIAGLISGQAAAYDIDGVDLPLNTQLLFEGNFIQNLVADPNSGLDEFSDFELQGYGIIDSETGGMFDVGFGDLCVSGPGTCQLTYTFSNIFLQGATPDGPALNLAFDASEAKFDFWLHQNNTVFNVARGLVHEIADINDPASVTAANTAWQAKMDLFSGNDGANVDVSHYINTTALEGAFSGRQNFSGTSVSEGPLEVDNQTVGAGWYFDKVGSTTADLDTADVFVEASINRNSYSNTQALIGPVGSQVAVALSSFGSHSFATSVPEPSTLAMFSVALLGFGAAARRRRQA